MVDHTKVQPTRTAARAIVATLNARRNGDVFTCFEGVDGWYVEPVFVAVFR